MAKASAKKVVAKKLIPAKKIPVKKTVKRTGPVDYFKLPFEVYYSDAISVTTYELMSDVDEVQKFKDVKAVHMEQGESYGAVFFCNNNNGAELYCALNNSHEEMAPPWYSFEEEEDTNFSYGCNYAVEINGNDIKFVDPSREQEDEDSSEYLDFDAMDQGFSYGFYEYHIADASPDYIILDALDSKIKIDLDGYALDEDGEPIESQRIINVDELDGDQYGNYETQNLYQAKRAWIKSVLAQDFPEDANLDLNPDSE